MYNVVDSNNMHVFDFRVVILSLISPYWRTCSTNIISLKRVIQWLLHTKRPYEKSLNIADVSVHMYPAKTTQM